MFWLPDVAKLRSLKMTIGSKIIFKYRLYFFTNLDAYLKQENKQSADFSVQEKDMVMKMVRWEDTNRSLLTP